MVHRSQLDNTRKTKQFIVDFRKCGDLLPLSIKGDHVESVHSFKFLGTLISDRLTWIDTTAAVKKGTAVPTLSQKT